MDELKTYYRRIEYTGPRQPGAASGPGTQTADGAAPAGTSGGAGPAQAAAWSGEPGQGDIDNFLQLNLPEFPSPDYRARKFLGAGTFGMVGLWEYQGDDDYRRGECIVVKYSRREDSGFKDEAKHMRLLQGEGSVHVSNLRADTPGLGQAGYGERIYMDYYRLGSLDALLSRRIQSQKPFHELTLWYMFKCLVDGCSTMELAGGEYTYDANANPRVQAPNKHISGWTQLVHFDMKPDNVLLGERDSSHVSWPVGKIADFGVMEGIADAADRRVKTMDINERYRTAGTPGYYAPEQFTERWDFSDWRTGEIAGSYGSHTNVWGIGCIMYQLINLSTASPDGEKFFNHQGGGASKLTYGVPITNSAYSQELKNKIHSCLYDLPSQRPTLRVLKEEVHLAIDALERIADPVEPWEDFDPDPPPPPKGSAGGNGGNGGRNGGENGGGNGGGNAGGNKKRKDDGRGGGKGGGRVGKGKVVKRGAVRKNVKVKGGDNFIDKATRFFGLPGWPASDSLFADDTAIE